jgi:hypothetical protein
VAAIRSLPRRQGEVTVLHTVSVAVVGDRRIPGMPATPSEHPSATHRKTTACGGESGANRSDIAPMSYLRASAD